jgi:ABC-type nitrate/sulfonate/bicarbonate transport system permease component
VSRQGRARVRGVRAGILSWSALLPLATGCLIIGLWQLLAAGAHSYYFPTPQAIAGALGRHWAWSGLRANLLPSLVELAGGIGVGCLAGLLLGCVIGATRWVRLTSRAVVEFLRTLPAAALLPAGLVVLGTGTGMRIAITAFVCAWPIVLNVIDGLDRFDPVALATARVYGIGFVRRWQSVLLPGIARELFAGVRNAVALGIIMVVIAEMFTSSAGIGYFLSQAQQDFDLTGMWSGIVVLGLLGIVLNKCVVLVERAVFRWER